MIVDKKDPTLKNEMVTKHMIESETFLDLKKKSKLYCILHF